MPLASVSKVVAASITSVSEVTPPASDTASQENVTEVPDGSAIRSALQEYCTQLAVRAQSADEQGDPDLREAILAELRAPVGDHVAGLRQWLTRNHPAVARELHDRLCAPHKAKASTTRLCALEDVFRNLPPDFVKYRLGIDVKETDEDPVALVADAMRCTRHEAIKRLASVLPDLTQLENDSDIKDTVWSDRIGIHDHQNQAVMQQTKENNHVIRPE